MRGHCFAGKCCWASDEPVCASLSFSLGEDADDDEDGDEKAAGTFHRLAGRSFAFRFSGLSPRNLLRPLF